MIEVFVVTVFVAGCIAFIFVFNSLISQPWLLTMLRVGVVLAIAVVLVVKLVGWASRRPPTHYDDSPPVHARTVTRIIVTENDGPAEGSLCLTRELAVEVFIRHGCALCQRAQYVLGALGVIYKVRPLESPPNCTYTERIECTDSLSLFSWMGGNIDELPLIAVVRRPVCGPEEVFKSWTGRDVARRDEAWINSARTFFEAHTELLKAGIKNDP